MGYSRKFRYRRVSLAMRAISRAFEQLFRLSNEINSGANFFHPLADRHVYPLQAKANFRLHRG